MSDKDHPEATDYNPTGYKVAVKHWGAARMKEVEEEFRGYDDAFWKYATEAWALFDRPALTIRERSLCMVAVQTCLGEPGELSSHIKAARANGATPEEIKEVIVQCCLYAGMPKGRAAFKAAITTMAELDKKR